LDASQESWTGSGIDLSGPARCTIALLAARLNFIKERTQSAFVLDFDAFTAIKFVDSLLDVFAQCRVTQFKYLSSSDRKIDKFLFGRVPGRLRHAG